MIEIIDQEKFEDYLQSEAVEYQKDVENMWEFIARLEDRPALQDKFYHALANDQMGVVSEMIFEWCYSEVKKRELDREPDFDESVVDGSEW